MQIVWLSRTSVATTTLALREISDFANEQFAVPFVTSATAGLLEVLTVSLPECNNSAVVASTAINVPIPSASATARRRGRLGRTIDSVDPCQRLEHATRCVLTSQASG